MARCPSQDWDDHICAQDAAAEAERVFYANNAGRIIAAAARIAAGADALNWGDQASVLVPRSIDVAASIVREVVSRGSLE